MKVSKAVIRLRRIEGSNPSPSAQRCGFPLGARFRITVCGLEDFSSQSMDVHRDLQKSTGLGRHWRTPGALSEGHFVSAEATTPLTTIALISYARRVIRLLAKTNQHRLGETCGEFAQL